MVWEDKDDAEDPKNSQRLHKGTLVKLRTPCSVVYALVTGLTIPNPTRSLDPKEDWLAELELVGESDGDDSSFRYGVSSFPTLGDPSERRR